jgi:16S rRNA (uracil1498-N3)-methyltransferase
LGGAGSKARAVRAPAVGWTRDQDLGAVRSEAALVATSAIFADGGLGDRMGVADMHRFFVPQSWIQGNRVIVTGRQAHQIARVLRMRTGDLVMVLDNSGWEIETQLLSVDPNVVTGEVQRRRLSQSEPRTKISLYQAVLKGSSFQFVLQKGTELGIVEFVPIIADRCVMSDLEAVEKKRLRWESIIQEASEQCRRGRKPALRTAMLFPQVCEKVRHSGGLALILWEEERQTSLRFALRGTPQGQDQRSAPFSVHLVVGPEGGFTRQEIVVARNYGLVPITLGPRILRGETAGLVAASAILYELGDLG